VAHARGHRKPRIKIFGRKGRGLQAVASKPDLVVYRAGDMIGRLTGKITSAESASKGWSVEFVSPDRPQLGPICHIDCHEVGTYMRLLNHSCAPSAKFKTARISGMYGFIVEAIHDIYDGEEITVSYGKDYFRGLGLECLCEICLDE
jgi:hypothetical protein